MFGWRRGDLVDAALDLGSAVVGRAADAWERFTAPWRPVRVRLRSDDAGPDAVLRNLRESLREAQRLQDRKTESALRADARAAGIAAGHVDFALHLYAQLVREVGEAMIVEPPVFFESLKPSRAYLFEDRPSEPYDPAKHGELPKARCLHPDCTGDNHDAHGPGGPI